MKPVGEPPCCPLICPGLGFLQDAGMIPAWTGKACFCIFFTHLRLQFPPIKALLFSLRMMLFDKEGLGSSSLHYLSPPVARIAPFPVSGICL